MQEHIIHIQIEEGVYGEKSISGLDSRNNPNASLTPLDKVWYNVIESNSRLPQPIQCGSIIPGCLNRFNAAV